MSCRKYVISSNGIRHSDAYDYCENNGMGLAMWHTVELYEDIQYLTHTTNRRLLTALNNKYDQNCTSKDDCHGKLIWQQEKNGPEKLFETQAAYDLIKAKNDPPNRFTVQIVNNKSFVGPLASHKATGFAVCGGKQISKMHF